MPFANINGQKLFYTVQGRSTGGTPVVLVHGAGGTHLDWPPQLRQMAGRIVYALDLPGHGSSEPPGRSNITKYADIVITFIDLLQIRDVVIVGHSMGGAITLSIALHHHPSVTGLVLLGSGARLRVSPAIRDRVQTDFEAVAGIISDAVWSENAPAELVSIGRELLLQADPAVVQGDFDACNDFDVMNELAEITLPTLVIGGTADQMTPLKFNQFLAEQIPNARLVVIEGSGHMMALEQPDEVAFVVTQFLDQSLFSGDNLL
jgi:pimeloyl-ACP methyl ester carboxylesterase